MGITPGMTHEKNGDDLSNKHMGCTQQNGGLTDNNGGLTKFNGGITGRQNLAQKYLSKTHADIMGM